MNSLLPNPERRLKGKIRIKIVAPITILLVLALTRCSVLGQDTSVPTPPPVPTAILGGPVEPPAAPTAPASVLGPAPVSGTKYLHDPFAKEQCGTCHDLNNQQNPAALWAPSVVETCRLCHWQLIDGPQPTHIHDPFPEGECLACHDPHASDQAFLLKKPQGDLCRDCHSGPRNQSHPSIASEECLLCHDGHGSEQQALLREPQAELCATCHADHTQENAAFKPHAEMAQDCSLCHDPHTGDMVDELVANGCRQCHEDVFTAQPAVSHPPVQAGFCTLCHNFHQEEQFALLAKPEPDVCRDCHSVGRPVEQTHPPSAPGECSLCHAGHGSDHEVLLRAAEPDLCATCHTESTHGNTDFAFRFTEQFQVACTDCHNPHGPVGNLALIRDEIQGNEITFTARFGANSFDEADNQNSDDLCATCHTDTTHNRNPSNRDTHPHFEDGTCTNCHYHNRDDDPATVDGFMLADFMCTQCHGQPPPPASDGYPLEETGLPHQFHASAEQLGYDCQTCHDTSNVNYAGHNTTPPSYQDVWFDDFNPNGTYDAGTRACGGLYCHSNGTEARSVPGRPVYRVAVWTDPASGECGTCHGVTRDTLRTGIHAQHLRFAECSTCHTEHEQPTHVNEQVDFADGNTLADTEVCAPCHGDQTDQVKQTLLPQP